MRGSVPRLDPRTVAPGDQVPTVVRSPDRLSILLFCIAYWAPHRIHSDPEWARSEGYHDVVVNGPLMNEYVVSMLADWTGDPAHLRRFRVRYHASAFAGDTLTIRASVRQVGPLEEAPSGSGGDTRPRALDCPFTVTRQDGTVISSGEAQLVVPVPA